jgi:single-strand DNA-binding protein
LVAYLNPFFGDFLALEKNWLVERTVMSLNSVTLVGRAGRDPEVRYFESGSVVCNLPLAVDRRRRNSDQPDWFDLEIWDRRAEVAANYVRKGKLIGIRGRLKFDHWQDRNTGAQRSKPVIRVDDLELLGSKRENEAAISDASGSGYEDEF